MLDPSRQPAADILTKLVIVAIVIYIIEAYLHSKIDERKKKKKNQNKNKNR